MIRVWWANGRIMVKVVCEACGHPISNVRDGEALYPVEERDSGKDRMHVHTGKCRTYFALELFPNKTYECESLQTLLERLGPQAELEPAPRASPGELPGCTCTSCVQQRITTHKVGPTRDLYLCPWSHCSYVTLAVSKEGMIWMHCRITGTRCLRWHRRRGKPERTAEEWRAERDALFGEKKPLKG